MKRRSQILGRRLSGLRDLITEARLSAYLVTDSSDILYLTGLSGEGLYALVGLSRSWLIVPALSEDQAKNMLKGIFEIKTSGIKGILDLCKKYKLKKNGFCGEHVNYKLGLHLSRNGFLTSPSLIKALRIVKDEQEIRSLKKACHLVYLASQYASRRIKPGRTEKQIAYEIECFFRKKGSEGSSFSLIVANGSHSAIPHHVTSDSKIKPHQPVVMDIGCIIEGYRSDLTRTIHLGKIDAIFRRIYKIVESAQKAGIGKVRAGVAAKSVDEAARSVISRAGYGDRFIHSTGHGVGLDIHEPPWISAKSADILKSGMVITVEPGIYLPGKFGVRLEDTLLVTDKGHEILTK